MNTVRHIGVRNPRRRNLRRRNIRLAALGLLAASARTACASDDTDEGTAQSATDPCSLPDPAGGVGADELTAAPGVPVPPEACRPRGARVTPGYVAFRQGAAWSTRWFGTGQGRPGRKRRASMAYTQRRAGHSVSVHSWRRDGQ